MTNLSLNLFSTQDFVQLAMKTQLNVPIVITASFASVSLIQLHFSDTNNPIVNMKSINYVGDDSYEIPNSDFPSQLNGLP